jgi:predicted oxidoreductase (fatty acid repression mutant protein)
MTSSSTFFEAVKARRTIYQLSSESPVPDSKIKEIVKEAVLHVPSSFNSQSTRVVVLLGDEHKKLWGDIVKPAVKAVAPEEAWPSSEQKLSGFQAAYGTVLFYEDPKPVSNLQQNFPLYADKFPQWSEHTNAMHQFASKSSQKALSCLIVTIRPIFLRSSQIAEYCTVTDSIAPL